MSAYDGVVRRRWLVALLAGAAAGLAVAGVLFAHSGSRQTTFYTPAEVRSALTRAGLKLLPPRSPTYIPIGPEGPLPVQTEILAARGRVYDPGAGAVKTLFIVLVVTPNRNVDAAEARRWLRNVSKGWKWQVDHYPKHFHARRANVFVYGLRGLSASFRDRLAETLRSLPNHGDPTAIE